MRNSFLRPVRVWWRRKRRETVLFLSLVTWASCSLGCPPHDVVFVCQACWRRCGYFAVASICNDCCWLCWRGPRNEKIGDGRKRMPRVFCLFSPNNNVFSFLFLFRQILLPQTDGLSSWRMSVVVDTFTVFVSGAFSIPPFSLLCQWSVYLCPGFLLPPLVPLA